MAFLQKARKPSIIFTHFFLIFLYGSIIISCGTKKSTVEVYKKRFDHEGQILEWYYDEEGKLKFNEPMRDLFMIWKGQGPLLASRREYHDLFTNGEFLNGMKKKDVLEYFGPDESPEQHKDHNIVTYETEGNCDNPEMDCCWADFYFDENDLVKSYALVCS